MVETLAPFPADRALMSYPKIEIRCKASCVFKLGGDDELVCFVLLLCNKFTWPSVTIESETSRKRRIPFPVPLVMRDKLSEYPSAPLQHRPRFYRLDARPLVIRPQARRA